MDPPPAPPAAGCLYNMVWPVLQVESRGLNRRVVDVSGTLVLMPYRSILVPASLLLPETLPIRATISIGVNGDFGAGVVSITSFELDFRKWQRAFGLMCALLLLALQQPLGCTAARQDMQTCTVCSWNWQNTSCIAWCGTNTQCSCFLVLCVCAMLTL